MTCAVKAEPRLPLLRELGTDLLKTTPRQRWFSVARPFLFCGLYFLFASMGWWVPAVAAIAFLFISIVATAHDLVHQSLGLRPRWNELLLSLVGMIVLESGHAYKVTHLRHHSRFPERDDPEGDPAHMSFWRAIAEGPIFLFRLWWWAWKHAPAERPWLAAEALWFGAVLVAGILLRESYPPLLVYGILVIVGSWTYPVSTVYLPHNVNGDNALFQTLTLRGRVVPALFLELTYHLEHHLYPSVPSHHYAELAERLEPHLREAGVEPVRVW